MKNSREFSIPLFVLALVISMASRPAFCIQIDPSNDSGLQMTLSNNTALFTVYTSNTNGLAALYFNSDLTDPLGWTQLQRGVQGQTNLVVDNLPPGQGFFVAVVTNAIRPGFDQQFLDRNDDGSTPQVPIGFTVNFFNNTNTMLFVNNNGNVTFSNPQAAYTPTPLNQLKIAIIAPYWADVDTRNTASDVVRYGNSTVGTNNAFAANWVNVGYYNQHADYLLSCQLVIIDRSTVSGNSPGDFDLEFNYDKVQWEWGDVSYGSPARVGFSDGVNDYELENSGVEGALPDTNTVTGLIYNSLKSSVPGRYVFQFRNGQPVP